MGFFMSERSVNIRNFKLNNTFRKIIAVGTVATVATTCIGGFFGGVAYLTDKDGGARKCNALDDEYVQTIVEAIDSGSIEVLDRISKNIDEKVKMEQIMESNLFSVEESCEFTKTKRKLGLVMK